MLRSINLFSGEILLFHVYMGDQPLSVVKDLEVRHLVHWRRCMQILYNNNNNSVISVGISQTWCYHNKTAQIH